MKKSLIYFVLSLVLLLAVGAAYGWWYLHVFALRTEVGSLAADTESVNLQAAQISSARSALAKLAADESFFGSYFVSTSTVVSYLENLESTGHELGTVLEVVSVTPEPGDDSRLSVAFKSEGSFAAVMRTLGGIEYGAYDVVLSNLNLETNASSEGKWIATGTLSVGMKPSEPKKAAAPAPAPTETDL